MSSPEDNAKENIDRLLSKAVWPFCDYSDADVLAYRGSCHSKLRFKTTAWGLADYLLDMDG